MSAHRFAYYCAYVLAAPISSLIIGANLNQAYCSRHTSLRFNWGTHAIAVLCLIFIIIILGEICIPIEQESGLLVKSLDQPTPSQTLTPITVGSVEFLVQIYFAKILFRALGKSALAIISTTICCINFLVCWACAINILINLNEPHKQQANTEDLELPTMKLATPMLFTWLGSSIFAWLAIFGSQLYASTRTRLLDHAFSIRFFRNDHLITKIGVFTLQTTAFSAVLVMTIAFILFINLITGDTPTPATAGCFIFLNLMRIPVSCATLGFVLKRQEKCDTDRITVPFPPSLNANSMDNLPLEGAKKGILKNQVTVHTVRSQIYES